MANTKGKLGVLIEDHFDHTEFVRFNEYFPQHGYEVEYISHLWKNKSLTFHSNDLDEKTLLPKSSVTVTVELDNVEPADYKAILLIGAYAADRLRYEENPIKGLPNQSSAVNFLRKAVKAMDEGKIKIGNICHSLWLFCADPALIEGRKVTCAHNIMYDVQNAGGILVYDGNQLIDTYVDGNLICGRHPGVIEKWLPLFLSELEKGC
jgi:putative intracellular protease/amidase